MKDKTIWQEVLNRGKWVLILLVAFVLSQFPHGTCFVLAKQTVSDFTVRALSRCPIHSRFDCIHYWCTKTQLATFNLSFLRQKTWLAWY